MPPTTQQGCGYIVNKTLISRLDMNLNFANIKLAVEPKEKSRGKRPFLLDWNFDRIYIC